jgi:2-polyprenyl-6-methoxyphenol hydroxylase-like FAD-dependent oxidoreductase
LRPSSAAILREGAADTLIDEYAESRRYVAVESVQSGADKNYKDLAATGEAARIARNEKLKHSATDPKLVKEYLMGAAMMVRPPTK